MSVEIERKFILVQIPVAVHGARSVEIEQGYIFAGDPEVRLRRFRDQYFITIKSNGSITRKECEREIDEWAFRALWPKVESRIVIKRRCSVNLGGYSFEIDVYAGRHDGLIVLECEFDSVGESKTFVLPTVFGKATEVTSDSRFKNKNLAESGMPVGLERLS